MKINNFQVSSNNRDVLFSSNYCSVLYDMKKGKILKKFTSDCVFCCFSEDFRYVYNVSEVALSIFDLNSFKLLQIINFELPKS